MILLENPVLTSEGVCRCGIRGIVLKNARIVCEYEVFYVFLPVKPAKLGDASAIEIYFIAFGLH